MTRFSLLAPTFSFTQIGAEVFDVARKTVRALVHRRAVRQLYKLDDRMLKDIGLTRSDVTAALDVGPMDDPSVRLRRFTFRHRGV